jgi:hypothetical protein
MLSKLRSISINLGLTLISIILFILVMELVFPKILHKLPLPFYLGLGKDYKILGQYHKKSVIPVDYIALLGDSHALGSGDWYLQVVKKHKLTQGDYHSAHILYNKTGRDVLSFGALGSGSLRGLVLKPISYFKHVNLLRDFELKQPKEILVYFFEGNDLSDNMIDIYHHYRDNYDMARLYDHEYFKTFIEKEILSTDRIYRGEVPYKNWLFSRFLVESVGDNIYNEIKRGIKKFKRFLAKSVEDNIYNEIKPGIKKFKQVSPNFSGKVSPTNSDMAKVGEKELPIPHSTQQPALNLNEEQTRQAIYVFEQSLKYMAEFFSESKITIVYIPSPIAVYKWASPTITIVGGTETPVGVTPVVRVYERSDEIFEQIKTIAEKYNHPLIDTRPLLRATALKEPVHGPRDWYHPNKKGYEAIAQGILENTSLLKRASTVLEKSENAL